MQMPKFSEYRQLEKHLAAQLKALEENTTLTQSNFVDEIF
jgi:hypothetical protein